MKQARRNDQRIEVTELQHTRKRQLQWYGRVSRGARLSPALEILGRTFVI